MWWPLGLIILSNLFYNICTKAFPDDIDPFAALFFTYIAGAIIALGLSVSRTHSLDLSHSFSWPSMLLGFAIVGLEAGYVYLFRAGWDISKGSLVANTALAIILIFVGAMLYHEQISLRQALGVIVCLAGLYLVTIP